MNIDKLNKEEGLKKTKKLLLKWKNDKNIQEPKEFYDLVPYLELSKER